MNLTGSVHSFGMLIYIAYCLEGDGVQVYFVSHTSHTYRLLCSVTYIPIKIATVVFNYNICSESRISAMQIDIFDFCPI